MPRRKRSPTPRRETRVWSGSHPAPVDLSGKSYPKTVLDADIMLLTQRNMHPITPSPNQPIGLSADRQSPITLSEPNGRDATCCREVIYIIDVIDHML